MTRKRACAVVNQYPLGNNKRIQCSFDGYWDNSQIVIENTSLRQGRIDDFGSMSRDIELSTPIDVQAGTLLDRETASLQRPFMAIHVLDRKGVKWVAGIKTSTGEQMAMRSASEESQKAYESDEPDDYDRILRRLARCLRVRPPQVKEYLRGAWGYYKQVHPDYAKERLF